MLKADQQQNACYMQLRQRVCNLVNPIQSGKADAVYLTAWAESIGKNSAASAWLVMPVRDGIAM